MFEQLITERVALGPIFGGAGGVAFIEQGGDFGGDGSGLGFETQDRVDALPVVEQTAGLFGGDLALVHGAVGVADQIEEGAEGGGDVEVVVEGGGKFVFRNERARLAPLRGGGQFGEALLPSVEPLQRAAGSGQSLEGEVEREAVVGGEKHVAHLASGPAFVEEIAQGVEVAERFGHLASIDHEVGAMHP